VYFEVVGRIRNVETIAVGGRIRDIMRLRKQFGPGRWRKMKGIADIRLADGTIRPAEVHWYEAHGVGRRKMKVKQFLDWKVVATPRKRIHFALCIDNKDAEDLEKGKVYQVLTDPAAKRSGFVRVIDESKEDYLYPESYFAPIDLPSEVKKALLA
jgi:hypothetical protein